MTSDCVIDHQYTLFQRGIRVISDLSEVDRSYLYKYRNILFPRWGCISRQHVNDIPEFTEDENCADEEMMNQIDNTTVPNIVLETTTSGEQSAGSVGNAEGIENARDTFDAGDFQEMTGNDNEEIVEFDKSPYMVYYAECIALLCFFTL